MKKYLVIFEKTKTGFSVYVPDLPGCIATGPTKSEAEKNIFEAIEFHLQGLQEDKLFIPDNKTEAETMFFQV